MTSKNTNTSLIILGTLYQLSLLVLISCIKGRMGGDFSRYLSAYNLYFFSFSLREQAGAYVKVVGSRAEGGLRWFLQLRRSGGRGGRGCAIDLSWATL
jgi:hypothetical protein